MKVAAEREDCSSILIESPGASQKRARERERKRKIKRGKAISVSKRELQAS